MMESFSNKICRIDDTHQPKFRIRYKKIKELNSKYLFQYNIQHPRFAEYLEVSLIEDSENNVPPKNVVDYLSDFSTDDMSYHSETDNDLETGTEKILYKVLFENDKTDDAISENDKISEKEVKKL